MDQGYPRQYEIPAEPAKRKRGRPVGSKKKQPSYYDGPYGDPYYPPQPPPQAPRMPPPQAYNAYREPHQRLPETYREPYHDVPVAESINEVMAESVSPNTITKSDYDQLLLTIASDNNEWWDPSNGSWQWYVFLAAGLAIISAFVGYESVQVYKWWIEPGDVEDPDAPDEPEYIPPPLDEDDLLASTKSGGYSFMLPLFIMGIMGGLVWFYFLVKKATQKTARFMFNDLFAVPPFWILFSVGVYGFVAYLALAYSNSRRSMAGPLTTTERAIVSVMTIFMSFALLVVLIAMYRKLETASDVGPVEYDEPPFGMKAAISGLAMVIAALLGHIIWTHPGVIDWIEKNTFIGTQYRAYIVPSMVAATLTGLLLINKVWESRLVVPIVCISASLVFVFYLQAQLHTDFGKYSGVAGKGQGKVENECLPCDVYHQFTNGEKGNLVEKYARTVCDTRTGTLKRKEAARTKAFRRFDSVVAANSKCEKTCAQAKGILSDLTCKCTPGEQKSGILCDSVATLEFYKSYHQYNKDQGFGDSGKVSTFEIISVVGTGFGLLVVLHLANQAESLQPRLPAMNPFSK